MNEKLYLTDLIKELLDECNDLELLYFISNILQNIH